MQVYTFVHGRERWLKCSFQEIQSLFKLGKVGRPPPRAPPPWHTLPLTVLFHCAHFHFWCLALEIATAGKLRAVPHLVRGSNIKGLARNACAVCIQNDLEDVLGVSNETFAQFASRTLKANLSS